MLEREASGTMRAGEWSFATMTPYVTAEVFDGPKPADAEDAHDLREREVTHEQQLKIIPQLYSGSQNLPSCVSHHVDLSVDSAHSHCFHWVGMNSVLLWIQVNGMSPCVVPPCESAMRHVLQLQLRTNGSCDNKGKIKFQTEFQY